MSVENNFIFPGRRRDWATVFVGVVVFVRLALGMGIQLLSIARKTGGLSPFAFGGDDGEYYRLAARRIADGFSGTTVNPFPVAVGSLMRAFGVRSIYPFKWIGIAISLGVALGSGEFAGRQQKPGPSPGQWTILSVGVLPSLAFCSTNSFTRDVWIIAGFALASFSAARIVRTGVFDPLILFFGVVGGVACSALRPYAGAALVLGGVVWLVLCRVGRTARLGLIGAGCGLLVVFHGLILAHLNGLFALRDSAYSTGGSSVGISLSSGGAAARLFGYAYSFLFNILGPLPWQVRSPILLVSFLFDSVPMWIAIVLILRARKALESWCYLLIAFSVAYLALIAIFNDNLGAAGRLRIPSTVLLTVVACAAHSKHRGWVFADREKVMSDFPVSRPLVDLEWRNR